MSARLVPVVALAVLLAGCATLPGAGPDDRGPRTVNPDLRGTPTATPTPTPVPTPAGGLPPGVSTDGVDSERLVAAHRDALANRSFTTVRRQTVTRPNGRLLVNETLRVRVDPDAAGGRRVITQRSHWGNDQAQTTTYWTNGSVTVEREPRGNASANVVVTAGGPSRAVGVDPTGTEQVRTLFELLDPEFAGTVGRDGRRFAVLVARAGRVDRADLPEVRSVDLRALVAPDGTVVAYRLAYRTTQFGREALVVYRFRVSDVGDTTVERPPWVEGALAGNGTAAGTATATAGAGASGSSGG